MYRNLLVLVLSTINPVREGIVLIGLNYVAVADTPVFAGLWVASPYRTTEAR